MRSFFLVLLLCSGVMSLEDSHGRKAVLEEKAVIETSQMAKEELVAEKTLEKIEKQAEATEAVLLPEEKGFLPLQKLVSQEPGLLKGLDFRVQRFGSKIFSRIQLEMSRLSLFERAIPDEYPLGAGDRISVHFWNHSEDKTLVSEVDTDGNIQIPFAGDFAVGGLMKKELNSRLQNFLEKYFKEVQVSTSILKLRRFPVYVTGEVRMPGVFVANALSTPLQLLIAAGGITERGSYRSVDILREGKKIGSFDLYDFLLYGKNELGGFLHPGDVLNIGLSKKQIVVIGRVKRPGIFELLDQEKMDLLSVCFGGTEPDADSRGFQVVSFHKNGRPVLRDFSERDLKKLDLEDGMIILVHPARQDLEDMLEVRGAVRNPGLYQYYKGVTLSHLISAAQGFTEDYYPEKASVYRRLSVAQTVSSTNGVERLVQRKQIEVFLKDREKFFLEAGDKVEIFRLSDVQKQPFVRVIGDVLRAGEYPLYQGMKIRDLLLKSGLNDSAHLKKAEIHRFGESGLEILVFSPEKVMKAQENPSLLSGDLVLLFKDPQKSVHGYLKLEGMVKYPGVYPFREGEKLFDVVKRAGGLKSEAWLPAASFFRVSVRNKQKENRDRFVQREQKELERLKVDLLRDQDQKENPGQIKTLEGVSSVMQRLSEVEIPGRLHLDFSDNDLFSEKNQKNNLVLEDQDVFLVPRQPSEITILGQVYSPSTLLWKEGLKLEDYLDLAGGLTESAYKNFIYVIRASGVSFPIRKIRAKTNGVYVSSVRNSDNFSMQAEILPGDTIVVPTRFTIKKDRFSDTLDKTYKLAISVGALGGLFK